MKKLMLTAVKRTGHDFTAVGTTLRASNSTTLRVLKKKMSLNAVVYVMIERNSVNDNVLQYMADNFEIDPTEARKLAYSLCPDLLSLIEDLAILKVEPEAYRNLKDRALKLLGDLHGLTPDGNEKDA